MIVPKDYFNVTYFTSFFYRKLAHKKGGGHDGLTPQTFWKRYEAELGDIAAKCLAGSYRFSYYKEKLVLKGRNKLPRVLSIPTMRDRLVLGVLNEYLQTLLPDMVSHLVPNQYISSLNAFLAEQEGDIFWFKTDFEHFYDSLDHSVLGAKLAVLLDYPMWQIVMNAITTPTLASPPAISAVVPSIAKGIPQGLPISNILASIYMHDFDACFNDKQGKNFLYQRYVDDILIIDKSCSSDCKEWVEKQIQNLDLRLSLSMDKTGYGKIGESDIDYIGYIIKSKHMVSIRPKNVQSFLRRLFRLTTLLKVQGKNKALRPQFIFDDNAFYSYYSELLNEQIVGFKMEGHLFGWLSYFQAMNDMQLLYSLDNVIHKKLLAHSDIPKEVSRNILHLPVVYWNIKKKSGSLLMNFDQLDTDSAKRSFLLRRGKIDAKLYYSESDINRIFNAYKETIKKSTLASIGVNY